MMTRSAESCRASTPRPRKVATRVSLTELASRDRANVLTRATSCDPQSRGTSSCGLLTRRRASSRSRTGEKPMPRAQCSAACAVAWCGSGCAKRGRRSCALRKERKGRQALLSAEGTTTWAMQAAAKAAAAKPAPAVGVAAGAAAAGGIARQPMTLGRQTPRRSMSRGRSCMSASTPPFVRTTMTVTAR